MRRVPEQGQALAWKRSGNKMRLWNVEPILTPVPLIRGVMGHVSGTLPKLA